MQGTIGVIDLEKVEAFDVKAKEIKRRKWKKNPDMALGKIVRGQLETGERPICRRLTGAMKNVVKVENTEWIRTKKGWITKKR